MLTTYLYIYTHILSLSLYICMYMYSMYVCIYIYICTWCDILTPSVSIEVVLERRLVKPQVLRPPKNAKVNGDHPISSLDFAWGPRKSWISCRSPIDFLYILYIPLESYRFSFQASLSDKRLTTLLFLDDTKFNAWRNLRYIWDQLGLS